MAREEALILIGLVLAGLIFVQPAASLDDGGLRFKELIVTSEVIDHYHLCNISASIQNPTSETHETTFSLRLPEDAMLISMKLEKDGKTYLSRVEEKEEAREEYEDAVRRDHSASLVEWDPEWGAFQFSVGVPAGTEMVLEVEYGEMVTKYLGRYDLKVPLGDIGSYENFEKVRYELEVVSGMDITEVDTEDSTVDPDLDVTGDSSFYMEYVTTVPGKDDVIDVSFEEAPLPANGWMETCVRKDEGYFMHVFSPEVEEVGDYLPKDIVFVIDRSGSMSGEKIATVKSSFGNMLSQLNEEDRFNMVHFSDLVEKYGEEVIPATSSNIQDAQAFVERMDAAGSTDINGGLLQGLASFEGDGERVGVILFLTDGLPTSGVTDTSSIRSNVRNSNQGRVMINTLGYGYDHDAEFLMALALENEGRYRYIRDSSDADDLLDEEFRTVSQPILKDLEFSYSGGTEDFFPETRGILFEGSEVVVVGRYEVGTNAIDANVTADTSGGTRSFKDTFPVRDDGGPEHVMLMWAHRKIASVLDRITIAGESADLVSEVVSLAMDYSFVTPYTSFVLVLEETGIVDPDLDDIFDGDLNLGRLDGLEYDRSGGMGAPSYGDSEAATPFLETIIVLSILVSFVLAARFCGRRIR